MLGGAGDSGTQVGGRLIEEGEKMRRFACVLALACAVAAGFGSASAGAKPSLREVVAQHLKARWVSQGVQAWLNPPRAAGGAARAAGAGSPVLGTNVDAGDRKSVV